MNEKEARIQSILKNAKKLVVLSGEGVSKAAGLNGVVPEELAYDIESKYGYSSDEIVTSSFLTRRVDMFYDYYRNVILTDKIPDPPLCVKLIGELMKKGTVSAVITNTVYDLYELAGCSGNIININGSVNENKCPSCGKIFDAGAISLTKGVPVCPDCKVPLAPGFTLFGERLDSGRVNKACCMVEQADAVLLLGASPHKSLFKNLIKYFGDRTRDHFDMEDDIVLINREEELGDDVISNRLYGDINKITEKLLGDVVKETEAAEE